MAAFRFSRTPIDVESLRAELADPACGGYTSFEGLVRNHNEGLSVRHLEYEAFEPLAIKEGERIVAEAIERFGIEHAACVHRIGDLSIGEMAVWVGAAARHPFSLTPEMLRVAVNAEFGEWTQALADGDSVVFIPPVAGG